MIWPAVVMGFAGSLHCAGMCGPLALALPVTGANRVAFVAGRVLYNLGRIITYAGMGAVFGLVGRTFVFAGLQRGLSLAVGAVLLGWLVLRTNQRLSVRAGSLIPRLVAPLKAALAKQLRERSLTALFVVGLLNGLLPCGLVYLALAGAAGTGNATDGAVFMTVFGLGTAPMMLAIALFGKSLHAGFRQRFQRAVPALVATLAVFFILRGLSLGIPYISPDLSPEAIAAGRSCCH